MYFKLLFFISIFMSLSIKADIYRRTGTDGRVYYTDRPDKEMNFNLMVRAVPKLCKKVSLNKLPIKQIEKKVRNMLSDPYSAHFKWSNNVCDSGEHGNYCGFVNAKNRYGGYVGYAPFKVDLVKTSKGWSVNDIKMGDDVWCKNTDE